MCKTCKNTGEIRGGAWGDEFFNCPECGGSSEIKSRVPSILEVIIFIGLLYWGIMWLNG